MWPERESEQGKDEIVFNNYEEIYIFVICNCFCLLIYLPKLQGAFTGFFVLLTCLIFAQYTSRPPTCFGGADVQCIYIIYICQG